METQIKEELEKKLDIRGEGPQHLRDQVWVL
jgi:hypothetical protein